MDPETRFRALFDVAYGPLCRYARHRGLTGPDAEDLVAQTLEVAWRRIDDVLAAEPLAWLYAVAHNLWRNQRRRDRRRRELVARFKIWPQPAVCEDPADLEPGVLRAALASLSDRDQEVLRLVAWDGLSPADVAVVLGCTPVAARTRLHRARGRLAARLGIGSGPQRRAAAGQKQYPAFPVTGQRVRFRLFQFRDGVPEDDTESVYTQDAAGQLSMSTTQGPRSAEITDVEYATRTWSRPRSSSVLLAGNLSPRLIRDQVASGGFTVVGTVNLGSRHAVEISWSRTLGRITTRTTLWVDAQTYVPLRSVGTMRAGPNDEVLETDTTDYQILPATGANLALLTPPIPAGFTAPPRRPISDLVELSPRGG